MENINKRNNCTYTQNYVKINIDSSDANHDKNHSWDGFNIDCDMQMS